MRKTSALCAALVFLSACGSTKSGSDGGVDPACDQKFGLKHVEGGTPTHVATCSDACGNGANPPTGGPHCITPLACRTFLDEQPICNWVHNLEHGHLVLLFNCPGGCTDVTNALDELRKTSPRIVVTSDPALPAKVGAVVWGWSWVGDSVNQDAIACLRQHQDQEAPEPGLACAQ